MVIVKIVSRRVQWRLTIVVTTVVGAISSIDVLVGHGAVIHHNFTAINAAAHIQGSSGLSAGRYCTGYHTSVEVLTATLSCCLIVLVVAVGHIFIIIIIFLARKPFPPQSVILMI
jgi:hypothetical protein